MLNTNPTVYKYALPNSRVVQPFIEKNLKWLFIGALVGLLVDLTPWMSKSPGNALWMGKYSKKDLDVASCQLSEDSRHSTINSRK